MAITKFWKELSEKLKEKEEVTIETVMVEVTPGHSNQFDELKGVVADLSDLDEVMTTSENELKEESERLRQEVVQEKNALDKEKKTVDEAYEHLDKEKKTVDEAYEHVSLKIDNFDTDMMGKFGKVLDKLKEHEGAIEELESGNRHNDETRLFDETAEAVLKNLIPKTTPIDMSGVEGWDEKENKMGLMRDGIGQMNRWNATYRFETLRSWMGSLDKKKFLELLNGAIKTLNATEYRTKKRSIGRLTRLRDFMDKRWEEMKKMNSTRWEQELAVGEGLVWHSSDSHRYNNRYRYSGRNRSSGEMPSGFQNAKLMLRVGGELVLEANMEDDEGKSDYEDFEFSRITSSMETVFGISNIVDGLGEHIAGLKKIQTEQQKEVNEAREEFKQEFAKEILISKTKAMNKRDD